MAPDQSLVPTTLGSCPTSSGSDHAPGAQLLHFGVAEAEQPLEHLVGMLSQPGAEPGKLTQCPVSGVVFTVDASRPRVRVAREDYVTCCDKCAVKLKRDPRHYLKV